MALVQGLKIMLIMIIIFLRDMVWLRNLCINTLHKGDSDDDDNDNNNNNNNRDN
jgi:hypothetical protein